jgi:hypothetical protein
MPRFTRQRHYLGLMDQPTGPSGPNVERSGGWLAALLELEHQAVHLETAGQPDAAEVLFTAIEIARAGGLRCEHRRPMAD